MKHLKSFNESISKNDSPTGNSCIKSYRSFSDDNYINESIMDNIK